jgi:hypothetical protein
MENRIARSLWSKFSPRRDLQHAGAPGAEVPIRHRYSRFQDLGPYEGHAVDSFTLSARETAEQVCSSFRNFMILD